jgi:hypothetical protein
LERCAVAAVFLQGFPVGGDGVRESRRPALPPAEHRERNAEILLRHGPVERSFRTRRESEAPAIDADRFGQRGIVTEFVSVLKEFGCLIEQETPLPLCVERRDE